MQIFIPRRAFVAGMLATPFTPGSGQAQSSKLSQAVDAAAREFMVVTNAQGLAIGLVSAQGRQLFNYGVADPASCSPVDDGTLFEIGSISKTFTVALTAVAFSRGALSWNDAPGKHVPEVRGPGTDRLTLRDLATHATGGMPLQLPAEARTWDEAAAWFRKWTPPAERGLVRAYSNPSIGLLGVVTARALNGDFAALMREHVLTPLGLYDTHYSLPRAAMARYAQGQTRDGRPARMTQAVLATEAYGLRITTSDLLRWLEAQMGLVPAPGGLAQALKTTQAGHLQVGPMTQGAIWEWYPPPLSERDLLEGSGDVMVFKPNRGTPLDGIPPPAGALVNKTGGTNGFSAYAAFMAERGIGLAILANRNHPVQHRRALAKRLRDAVEA
ncbi:MAG: serine hydrolase [Beijerinckiaceae bacterium]